MRTTSLSHLKIQFTCIPIQNEYEQEKQFHKAVKVKYEETGLLKTKH